jgi:hypothetical protein
MARDRFNCKDGTKANEEMMIAVYDAGNTLRKPVGSGWYAAELEAGVYGVSQAGLYGCKFNVVGRLTECGAAAFREVPTDIVITRASAGPGTNQAIMQPARQARALRVHGARRERQGSVPRNSRPGHGRGCRVS